MREATKLKPNVRIIYEAADVDEQVLLAAEETLGWFDGRINWEDFIDRLADYGQYEDPPFDFETYDSPAVRKIQRFVRELA